MRLARLRSHSDRSRDRLVAKLAHEWWRVPKGTQDDLLRERPDVFFTIATLVAWHNIEHNQSGHKDCP